MSIRWTVCHLRHSLWTLWLREKWNLLEKRLVIPPRLIRLSVDQINVGWEGSASKYIQRTLLSAELSYKRCCRVMTDEAWIGNMLVNCLTKRMDACRLDGWKQNECPDDGFSRKSFVMHDSWCVPGTMGTMGHAIHRYHETDERNNWTFWKLVPLPLTASLARSLPGNSPWLPL